MPAQRFYGKSEPESGEVSDYQLKDPSEIPRQELKKAAPQKHLELDFKDTSVTVSKTIPPAQRTRVLNTGNISVPSGDLVGDVYAARALLAH